MTKTIPSDRIKSALYNASVEYGSISDTYMGRHSVEQDPCLSVVFVGKRGVQRGLCEFFVWLAYDLSDELGGMDIAAQLARDVCTDDLGLDMIVYFPGWTLAD